MIRPSPPLSSNQPDLDVLSVLGVVQRISLAIIALVAGVILCAWLVPPLGQLLPYGWMLMKANTAVLALLSGLSLALSQPRRSSNAVLASRLLGVFVLLLSAVTLSQYVWHFSAGIDTLLSPDSLAATPGRMSAKSAISFLLVGIVLSNIRARKGYMAHLIDAVVLALTLLLMTFVAGYIFGAWRLFVSTAHPQLSPQTFLCLSLLTFLIFNRRTEYGVFSILIGNGIGGKIARLASPIALALPFTLAIVRGLVVRFHKLPEDYSIAAASSIMSLSIFCLTLALSKRCNDLESATRELSLCDELTQLYNRRGFYVLGEQALRLANRAGEPFSVLFIDVDNLKQINDEFGHEAGSDLLEEMALILRQAFREIDIIGRLGGDEFVVAANVSAVDISAASRRLEEEAATFNLISSRRYPLSFSMGWATSGESNNDTLEHLLERADSTMYEAKRSKKHSSRRRSNLVAVY